LDYKIISVIALAIAASPASAQQRQTPISAWISSADIPVQLPAQAMPTSVSVEYKISKIGTATDCRVTYLAGYRPLGDLTCSLIEERARYIPAFSKKGEPVDAKDVLFVSWNPTPQGVVVGRSDYGGALPLGNPSYWVTDLDNDKLVLKSPTDVQMKFSIGIDGRITSCEVPTPSGSPRADALSCSLLKARARFKPPVGRNGLPLPASGQTAFHWSP
jgi:hypothetical protein